MDQIFEIIFYLGAIQGILLTVFLLSVKFNKMANRLLGFLTLSWSIILLQFAVQGEDFYAIYPHLYKTFSNLVLVLFPLQYLYVKYLFYDLKHFKRADLWHFAPVIIHILLLVPFYVLSGPEKIEIAKNPTAYYKTLTDVINEGIALQGIVYSILIFIRLARYKKVIENFDSNIDKIILRAVYVGSALIFFAWILGTIATNLKYFNISINFNLFTYVYLIIVLVIYRTSYLAIKTPEVFKLDVSNMQMKLMLEKDFEVEDIKYTADLNEKSKPEMEELSHRLTELMNRDKPYLEPDLNLYELAEKIQISRNQLSYIINTQHQMNFNEFINSYRVEEVKRLMRDDSNSHLKIISLAYDSGFNSKASFNRVFKQMTGLTPSAFYDNQKEHVN